jgi:hypothetical protein
MQMLMPCSARADRAGGQELGLQFGDRLPQRHRVGEHARAGHGTTGQVVPR